MLASLTVCCVYAVKQDYLSVWNWSWAHPDGTVTTKKCGKGRKPHSMKDIPSCSTYFMHTHKHSDVKGEVPVGVLLCFGWNHFVLLPYISFDRLTERMVK